MPDQFITLQEACEILGISRDRLNRYVKEGRIARYHKLIGRRSYFKLSEVERLRQELSEYYLEDIQDDE